MKCPYCDNPVPNDVDVCPSCGAAIEQPVRLVTAQQQQQPTTNVSGFDCFLDAFRKYFTFAGRTSRRGYWMFVLFQIVIYVLLCTVSVAIEDDNMVLPSIFSFISVIPGLSVTSRRLHDAGHSFACILLMLIPMVGQIVILFFMCSPGDAHENEYGPIPAV